MKEQIKQIAEKAEKELEKAKDQKVLNDLKVQFLGKKRRNNKCFKRNERFIS